MSDDTNYLRALDKKLRTVAEKLRVNLDATVYKHAVLGLIFLKYVSDAFEIRQQEVEAKLRNDKDDYIASQADHHRKRTIEEEFLALLKKHNIDYDVRHVFEQEVIA